MFYGCDIIVYSIRMLFCCCVAALTCQRYCTKHCPVCSLFAPTAFFFTNIPLLISVRIFFLLLKSIQPTWHIVAHPMPISSQIWKQNHTLHPTRIHIVSDVSKINISEHINRMNRMAATTDQKKNPKTKPKKKSSEYTFNITHCKRRDRR